MVQWLTMENPDRLFDAKTKRIWTKLFGPDGEIWTYPVTDEELAAAAANPRVSLHNDTGLKWRQREIPED